MATGSSSALTEAAAAAAVAVVAASVESLTPNGSVCTLHATSRLVPTRLPLDPNFLAVCRSLRTDAWRR